MLLDIEPKSTVASHVTTLAADAAEGQI